jgi:hypothetical protein
LVHRDRFPRSGMPAGPGIAISGETWMHPACAKSPFTPQQPPGEDSGSRSGDPSKHITLLTPDWKLAVHAGSPGRVLRAGRWLSEASQRLVVAVMFALLRPSAGCCQERLGTSYITFGTWQSPSWRQPVRGATRLELANQVANRSRRREEAVIGGSRVER